MRPTARGASSGQRPGRGARRLAWAACLAGALGASPARADQADPWWGPDKKLHYGLSAGIAAGAYGGAALLYSDRAPRLLWGGGIALAAGIGKEAYDLTGRGDPSWRDLTWDAAGVATGLGVALLIDLALRGLHLTPEPEPAR